MSSCPKKYIPPANRLQWIYLTLLSTICVQIHQITYVILETISNFLQQNSFVSFQLKHYILSTKVAHQSANFPTFSLLRLNFTKFFMPFFKEKVSFSSKYRSFFRAMRDNSSVLFRLKLYVLLAKVAHQSENFQTCHCSH